MNSYSSLAEARDSHHLVLETAADIQAAPSTRGRPREWVVFIALLAGAVWMFSVWSQSEGTTSTDGVDEVNTPALIH
jgi:hypothetical protein